MKRPCKYCAQINTKKDEYGYCKIYSCWSRSGNQEKLTRLLKKASDLFLIPQKKMKNISGPVSNFYYVRTREANNIMSEAKELFGFIPFDLLNHIPQENQKPWDQNIRW